MMTIHDFFAWSDPDGSGCEASPKSSLVVLHIGGIFFDGLDIHLSLDLRRFVARCIQLVDQQLSLGWIRRIIRILHTDTEPPLDRTPISMILCVPPGGNDRCKSSPADRKSTRLNSSHAAL